MAIRDKFMISKLMNSVRLVNDYLTEYKFGDAQMTSYSLWMDNICDIFIELMKPIVYDLTPENADARWAAQATLWITIESGLSLLHPMMPFVTEELWQRLPGRGTLGADETETIMIAPYPECVQEFINEGAEESMGITMNIIRACRSLRPSYNIGNKILTKFFVKVASGAHEDAALAQTRDIMTLGKAESVNVNMKQEDIPQSVGLVIVDESTTVQMDLTGLVDYDAEIKKLEKSLSKTLALQTNLEKKINAPGYEKASEDLKKNNSDKLDGLKKKSAEMDSAINFFKRLAAFEKK